MTKVNECVRTHSDVFLFCAVNLYFVFQCPCLRLSLPFLAAYYVYDNRCTEDRRDGVDRYDGVLRKHADEVACQCYACTAEHGGRE